MSCLINTREQSYQYVLDQAILKPSRLLGESVIKQWVQDGRTNEVPGIVYSICPDLNDDGNVEYNISFDNGTIEYWTITCVLDSMVA